MTAQPDPVQRNALKADIATTRAELGETLEALAAKTQVKERAGDAAKSALGGATSQIMSLPARALAGVNSLLRSLRSLTTPTQRRLSLAAVLAGSVTALVAALRPGRGNRGRS